MPSTDPWTTWPSGARRAPCRRSPRSTSPSWTSSPAGAARAPRTCPRRWSPTGKWTMAGDARPGTQQSTASTVRAPQPRAAPGGARLARSCKRVSARLLVAHASPTQPPSAPAPGFGSPPLTCRTSPPPLASAPGAQAQAPTSCHRSGASPTRPALARSACAPRTPCAVSPHSTTGARRTMAARATTTAACHGASPTRSASSGRSAPHPAGCCRTAASRATSLRSAATPGRSGSSR
mmetsp:Transcript_17219/g.53305  ORF Transcript_17219/g.53305 Transcript_17219/m.53305 type:complete len:236 (-) Transcript_17219:652-1359(-)